MLNNKKLNFIFALLLAIGLWAYVLGEINPVSTEIIRNVPINFINQGAMAGEDLVVLESSEETVNITFSGQRSRTSKVKTGDFRVTCDLEGLDEGTHEVDLMVSGPEGVKVESLSETSIYVTVEPYITVSKAVRVIKTDADSSKYIEVRGKSVETVTVSGPKSLVNAVRQVQAVISCVELAAGEHELSAKLVPVDLNGNVVEKVTMNHLGVVLDISVTELAGTTHKENGNLNSADENDPSGEGDDESDTDVDKKSQDGDSENDKDKQSSGDDPEKKNDKGGNSGDKSKDDKDIVNPSDQGDTDIDDGNEKDVSGEDQGDSHKSEDLPEENEGDEEN